MKRLRRLVGHPAVKAAYFTLLVAAAVFYLVRWGDRVPELLANVRPGWVLAALGATILAALVYSFIQYTIYHRLGAPLSYWITFRIITIAQLGKYLPGKVMFVGNYYLLSRAAGVSNVQVGTSFVISQALWMLTACLCGLPVLSLLNPVWRYTVLLFPLALALLVHPRVLGGLLRLGQRLVGQARGEPLLLPQGVTATFYPWVAFLYLLNWGLAGLAAWFSLRAFGLLELGAFPLVLASIALGTVAGFLALFAPVGLGIREGLGAAILAPVVGADMALLGLLLLRGITVVVDLALALLTMIVGGQARHVE